MEKPASLALVAALTLGFSGGLEARAQAAGQRELMGKEQSMVVTMLEARVAPDKEQDLLREYGRAGDKLPPAIIETFLLRAPNSEVWKIVTVWRSQDALKAYRVSVDIPEGVRIFRVVGSEPTLSIFDVAAHVGS